MTKPFSVLDARDYCAKGFSLPIRDRLYATPEDLLSWLKLISRWPVHVGADMSGSPAASWPVDPRAPQPSWYLYTAGRPLYQDQAINNTLGAVNDPPAKLGALTKLEMTARLAELRSIR